MNAATVVDLILTRYRSAVPSDGKLSVYLPFDNAPYSAGDNDDGAAQGGGSEAQTGTTQLPFAHMVAMPSVRNRPSRVGVGPSGSAAGGGNGDIKLADVTVTVNVFASQAVGIARGPMGAAHAADAVCAAFRGVTLRDSPLTHKVTFGTEFEVEFDDAVPGMSLEQSGVVILTGVAERVDGASTLGSEFPSTGDPTDTPSRSINPV